MDSTGPAARSVRWPGPPPRPRLVPFSTPAFLLALCVSLLLAYPAAAQPDWPTAASGLRFGAATTLREWAHDQTVPAEERVGLLVRALSEEMNDPTPDLPWWSLTHPYPEVIQMVLVRGLAEVGDPGALKAPLGGADPELRKRIILALAASGEMGLTAGGREVLDELLLIIRWDTCAFLREQAAQCARDLGRARLEAVPDMLPVLRAALSDPATAPLYSCVGIFGEIPLPRWPVREAAWSALKGLDISEGVPEGVRVIRNAEGWVALRDALEPYGGVLRWGHEKEGLTATISLRDDIVVVVTVGQPVAWINEQQVEMSAPARLFYGQPFVPHDLLPHIAAVLFKPLPPLPE